MIDRVQGSMLVIIL